MRRTLFSAKENNKVVFLLWVNSSLFSVTSTSGKKKKAAAAVAFQCRSARRVCRVVLDPAAVTLCFGGSRSERKALALSKGTLWFASWGHRARRNLKVYISKATMGGRQLKELMSGGREGEKGVEGYTFKTDERLEKN